LECFREGVSALYLFLPLVITHLPTRIVEKIWGVGTTNSNNPFFERRAGTDKGIWAHRMRNILYMGCIVSRGRRVVFLGIVSGL